jgi:phosphatidate cytidylyltransferase
MIHDPVFQMFASGVIALLVLFSLIGLVLSKTTKSASGQETVANLNARIRSWWVMIVIFLLAVLAGRFVTLILFGLLSFMSLREFLTLTPTRRSDHWLLALVFYTIIPAQYYLIGIDWYGLFSIFIPVYAFLLLPALAALMGDTQHFLMRAAKVQWGLMLAVFAISHAPALMMLEIPGWEMPPAFLLFYLLTVVQMSDVMQYVCGKLFGRRKLAPSVSPSKTLEGLLGGGLCATLGGTLLYVITPFTPWQAAGMSLAIVIWGFLGGLVLSAIKRDLGVKDWGSAIAGHGGVLDRLDSVAFAAPIFFHMTRYWFTP